MMLKPIKLEPYWIVFGKGGDSKYWPKAYLWNFWYEMKFRIANMLEKWTNFCWLSLVMWAGGYRKLRDIRKCNNCGLCADIPAFMAVEVREEKE